MTFVTQNISQRLGGLGFHTTDRNYKFAKIKSLKDEVKHLYPDIELIDMGIGEPDLPADPVIVEKLYQEAGKPENRWYADHGIFSFLQAGADYLENVYGVTHIDPSVEMLHGLGAKSILASLPHCFINPGDVTLMTIPGYPILGTHTRYLGGEVYGLPLLEKNDFYPDLDRIPKAILKRAKLLYINYPNNPTGQIATENFYKEVIHFASKNNIVVISDAAYGPITYNHHKPLSFLSMDGAKEVGVEIHSLSKAFNMTGWRLAFIAGNSEIIKLYSHVKAHFDSGQFRAIQHAGITAFDHLNIIDENRRRYARRMELLVKSLREVGFDVTKPKATFYCYVPIPQGTKSGVVFGSAEEASEYILRKAMVSTVPWDDAGAYLRFSVTFEAKNEEEEIKIIQILKERLMALDLVFKPTYPQTSDLVINL